MVLCPLSVTDGWVSEVANFAPKLRLVRYVGEKEHRRTLRREIHEYVKVLPLPSHVRVLYLFLANIKLYVPNIIMW